MINETKINRTLKIRKHTYNNKKKLFQRRTQSPAARRTVYDLALSLKNFISLFTIKKISAYLWYYVYLKKGHEKSGQEI